MVGVFWGSGQCIRCELLQVRRSWIGDVRGPTSSIEWLQGSPFMHVQHGMAGSAF